MDAFPAIKWFSPSDQTASVPAITCVRVDQHVSGVSIREWLGWSKISQLLERWPL